MDYRPPWQKIARTPMIPAKGVELFSYVNAFFRSNKFA